MKGRELVSQTPPTNLEALANYFEVLISYLINVEVLDLRSHFNQVREGSKVGKDSMVEGEEGDIRDLK